MAIYHVNELLTSRSPAEGFIALDTNILIQLGDDTHQYYHPTTIFFKKVMLAKNFHFVYFIPTRLELREYFRRRFLTLFLRKNYQHGPCFIGGEGRVDEYCAEHPKIKTSYEDWESLNDHEIKEIRSRCFRDFKDLETGIQRWQQLSHMALANRLKVMDEKLVSLKICYKSLGDEDLFPETVKKPRWEDQERYVNDFAFSAQDAAILNMATTSGKIFGIMTNDIDFVQICQTDEVMSKISCYTFNPRLIDERTD
ncbi:MAG: hypothetical protein HQK54_06680 [Oligoflexales bacterium]|nr:hypothetical protein [Oligoflexales bacterium]